LFHSQEDWAATYLHELAHATGHHGRMNRPQCFARFGSELYAKEELRAELASAMLSGQIGLSMGQSHIDSHAAYLSSWLDALRRDKSEIFKAAADAQRICDYLGHWMPDPVLVAGGSKVTLAESSAAVPAPQRLGRAPR
jgi:antirestriction protein ArdC